MSANGKTIRRITQHIPQDSLLKISFRNFDRDTIELFNNVYSKNVSYSMKKKNRWLLSTLLSDENYENDEAIVYSKHQCIEDQTPIKTVYLFDSLLNKKFGSPDATDQKLSRKSINKSSVMTNIEEKNNYTKKEYVEFENLKKRGQKKKKKSRKNHRVISTYIPEDSEQLPTKESYLLDVENRKNCAYIEEYVHLNNLSQINIEKPIHRKRMELTSYDIDKSKRFKRNFNQDDLTNSDFEWDKYDEDHDEEVEEINNIIYEENVIKPFLICEDNLLCRKEKNEKKKHKRKRKYQYTPKTNAIFENIKENTSHDTITESNYVVDISREILPSIVMNISLDSFNTDLDMLTDLCQCWCSDTSPRSILIDLENVMAVNSKNYLILKPIMMENTKLLALNVSFNMDKLDYSKILDRDFVNFRELLEYLQSIVEPDREARSPTNQEFLELDETIDGLDTIWITKRIENTMKIYESHNEWKKYKLDKNDVTTMILNIQLEPRTYTWECCEVCFCDFPEDEMTIIKSCQHRMCVDCLSSHLIYRLETGMENMNCPGTECSVTLDCATILSLLPWKQYYKRSRKLESLIIARNGTTCFYCHKATLSNGDSFNEVRKQLHYRCICGKIICNLCGKKQHWPTSCYEMKKHTQKLIELKDVELFSDKSPPMIVEGINCPKCFYFVMKIAGCNHMTCVCSTHFCWLCGDNSDEGIHKSDGFPCNAKHINNHLKFDLSFVLPTASKLRPKLYILSINERIKCFDKSRTKLFKQFNGMLISKLEYHDPIFNAKNLENLFLQLVWLTENLYVKAYQAEGRKHKTLQSFLKGSATMLLYYQNQISFKIEDICYRMKYSHRVNSRIKMKEHCDKLTKLFSDMKKFVSHMHILLQT